MEKECQYELKRDDFYISRDAKFCLRFSDVQRICEDNFKGLKNRPLDIQYVNKKDNKMVNFPDVLHLSDLKEKTSTPRSNKGKNSGEP